MYIITDSRITWGSSNMRWDAAQKAFASRTTADIFGFCGEAHFPQAILHQTLEQINSGLLLSAQDESAVRHERIKEVLEHAISKQVSAPLDHFTIYHGAREGELMASTFRLWKIDYSVGTGKWYDSELSLDETRSYLARIDGSGRNAVENRGLDWLKTEAGGTSRSAIWSFCDALASGADPFSGGAPQLVGLRRKGFAKNFGMIWNDRRYVAGLEVPDGATVNSVEWFNRLFERCDGESKTRLKNAQQHSKPDSANGQTKGSL
jgi:hypothetical protein